MNIGDEAAFRAFMTQTRQKASNQLDSSIVGAEYKEVIMELLKVADGAEALLNSARGESADTRMMKNKMEQIKREHFELKQRHERLKKDIFSELTDEIVAISAEAGGIAKRHAKEDPNHLSAKNIMAAAKKVVNKLAALTKAD